MDRKRTKKNRLPKRSRGRSKFEIALRRKIAGVSPDDDEDILSSTASSSASNLASPKTKRRRKKLRRERPSDTSFETQNDSESLVARLSQFSLQVCLSLDGIFFYAKAVYKMCFFYN